MAFRFHSAAFAVLTVLVTICCSLHIDHVAAANCPSGMKNCGKDTRCRTNIRSDVNNCGNCGVVCPRVGNATPTCTNGRCGVCKKNNYANCGNAKVNLLTNVLHCGECKRKCSSYPNAIPTCKNGRCSTKCKRGYADCNRNMARDGCETFIAGEDRRNCGGCGKPCREDQFPSAVAECTGGKCGILLCYRGQQDCNGKLADGCERNTFSNPNACGLCGSVCPVYPNAEPLCANQICRSVCKPGFHYCYGSEIDERGCSEIFFDEDANNCGGCNNVCEVGQSCQQGECKNMPA